MAVVSLILPTTADTPTPDVAPLRAALEAAGYRVEVLVAADATAGASAGPDGRAVSTADRGLAAAAVAGVREARGAIVLVLDPGMGYEPEDLVHVAAPLAEGRADLAIASRWAEGPGGGPAARLGRRIGALVRPLVGTSDPLSGLIGLRREPLDRAAPVFQAVGARFSIEILAKVPGRRVDVPVGSVGAFRGRLEWDDVRHLKRLADHRFGNLSRLVQFCVVGASGMVVDLSFYAAFQWLLARAGLAARTAPLVGGPLHLAVAGVLAVSIALVWNFTLNRRLTFSYARHGVRWRQFVKYALSNAVSVPLSLALRLLLPRSVAFFDRHKLAAAVVGIVAATGVSFSMSRWLVFRVRPAATDDDEAESDDDLADAPDRDLPAEEAPHLMRRVG